MAKRIPLEARLNATLKNKRMKPKVPNPPKHPSLGTNRQGPLLRNLEIPNDVENIDVARVTMKKVWFPSSMSLFSCSQRHSKICN